MLIIVIMIKIIGFTSLITKYDEKNEAGKYEGNAWGNGTGWLFRKSEYETERN